MIPTKQHIIDAYHLVEPHVHRTPVLTSTQLNTMVGASLFFKCENFQRMGAFKMRGAVHAIQKLKASEKAQGVVTHSSGNFGQALALAAKSLGVPAYIVMPENAPVVKVAAVKDYDGIVLRCPSTLLDRETSAQQIVSEKGARFIHPSNDLDVILGNATAAYELVQDHPALEVLVAPVGGGGLIAGTALAATYFGNDLITYAAEPKNVDDAYRSLHSGSIQHNETTQTIADGLRTHLGDINFPIIRKLVNDVIRVSEKEIIQAMRLLWERMKIVVEPSSAVALAAILKNKTQFQDKRIGIILSGGNVDVQNLPF